MDTEELKEEDLLPPPGSISPMPGPQLQLILMTFSQAIQTIMDGKKVTRVEWDDTNTYGLLEDGFLSLHIEGVFKHWLVSDGDMLAEDWYVLPERD